MQADQGGGDVDGRALGEQRCGEPEVLLVGLVAQKGDAEAAFRAGRGYLNLELDLETGKRSSRQDAIRERLCRITGAESATAPAVPRT